MKKHTESEGFIIVGFPRNISQVKSLVGNMSRYISTSTSPVAGPPLPLPGEDGAAPGGAAAGLLGAGAGPHAGRQEGQDRRRQGGRRQEAADLQARHSHCRILMRL